MARRRTGKKAAVIAGVAAVVAMGGAGTAIASYDDDPTDTPITGGALERAEEAALAETGGGTVTETEVGDEESKYEVEVTLDNGSQVDVQLDKDFKVVGSEQDGEGR
jgi:uncharacterized membrane protein YkoI